MSDIRVGLAVGLLAGLWNGLTVAAVIWAPLMIAVLMTVGAVTLTATALVGVLERERRQND